MIDRFEKFFLAIAEISRCWHKIAAEELSKYSLKSSHVTYLLTLARYPEGLTAPKLAELCGRDKADVSRTMATLEKKGLVVKEEVGASLYRGVYRLTEEGLAAAGLIVDKSRDILPVLLLDGHDKPSVADGDYRVLQVF